MSSNVICKMLYKLQRWNKTWEKKTEDTVAKNGGGDKTGADDGEVNSKLNEHYVI